MIAEPEQLHREKGDTWPKVLKYNFMRYGDSRVAMRHKHYGIWQRYTWKDYYMSVKYLALGLFSMGFGASDKLLIIGDNAPQWYYAELAAQANHGTSVGMYPDLTPTEIKNIAANSGARFAMVEDQEQVDKLLEIKNELPGLDKIIYWVYKGLSDYNDPVLIGYKQVVESGIEYEKENPGLFEQSIETGNADDVCAIVYTSGTTGTTPKGAVHTYNTMRAGSEYLLHLDSWRENDNIVPNLPPGGMTEQWFDIGCHLLSASILNFAERPETFQEDTREIGPTIVFYDARLWENQVGGVQRRIQEADVFKRFITGIFMPVGHRMAELRYGNRRPGFLQKALYLLAQLTVFNPIRDSLGLPNARICYTTGTMLSPDALKFYHALNLPLKNIYGSTEGGALTGTKDEDMKLDTLGTVHKGTEVRITDEGEIIYRQPGIFIGYYNDPKKTSEVIKDGWFYSGDSGYITEDGHVVIRDRIRDLVELANGEKLAPQFIESRLRFSPYIRDAWVLAGPERAYPSAIITINYQNAGRWAGERRIAYTTFTELSQKPEIYDLIEQDIDRINQTLSPGVRIKKFVNLHKEFDPDESELTRNRKLKRVFLEERYRELIEAIYSDKKQVPIEAQVRYRDGRTGTIKTTLNIYSIGEIV